VTLPWDVVVGYIEWYRHVSHHIIHNSECRSAIATDHTRGADIDANGLTQVTYVNLCFTFCTF